MAKLQKTEAEQMQFFKEFKERSSQAVAHAGAIRYYYDLAGTTICLCFAGQALIPYLSPALAHLLTGEKAQPDLTIYVWDSESTGVQPPKPPCERSDFTDRGDIWGFNSERVKTAFHWSEFSVNAMDLKDNIGLYWVKSTRGFPYWVYSSPFRTLFHWWMQKNGGQLLHAAAVATGNAAVLITGKGGSGKSSTAVNALHAGMLYLGDDYVVVKNDPEPAVYCLYSTAKLAPHDLERFPALKDLVNSDQIAEPEKETVFLYPHYTSQLRKCMPLKAIFAPQISGKEETILAQASFWHIHRAISFTTMSQLPGAGIYTNEFISKMTRSLPCFELHLGSRREKIPALITSFLNGDESAVGHRSQENESRYTGVKFSGLSKSQGCIKDTTKLSDDTSGSQSQPQTNNAQKPLISVIVPVYNGEKFVRAALENILSQNYPALDVIVVDDGSTDNTRKLIEGLPIDLRYFYQNNHGPASARNLGIRNATGDYIAFLDVDDYWPENNLHLMIGELLDDPDLDVVRGYAQLVAKDETGRVEFLGNPKESFPDYIGAGLYRKKVFGEVGLFDRTLQFGEDKDWYIRATELNRFIKRLDEVTLYVLRHGGNMTEGKNLVELNLLKVFKKYMDRKRSRIANTSDTIKDPN